MLEKLWCRLVSNFLSRIQGVLNMPRRSTKKERVYINGRQRREKVGVVLYG